MLKIVQIQILSFISEFSTTVYLHTCNLAYLSVWLSKRVELAKVWVGPQQGQGQGLGARQKAAAAAASPPPGVTPHQVASPPKRPNKAGVPLGQTGSAWEWARSEYTKEVAAGPAINRRPRTKEP